MQKMKRENIAYDQIKRLDTAICEAKRFIIRAKEWRENLNKGFLYNSGKESAAAKRASMDLTRALVGVRSGLYNNQPKI